MMRYEDGMSCGVRVWARPIYLHANLFPPYFLPSFRVASSLQCLLQCPLLATRLSSTRTCFNPHHADTTCVAAIMHLSASAHPAPCHDVASNPALHSPHAHGPNA